ncbi:heme biosynthesis protein HemY [Rhodobacter sp. Har01]|uniref:heme biosynthesis protein HemY n=1 Tax=Rhodobacter sp. Har01 TaxID=2883999 RepID=UPI001D061B46|nr:heme biosynthesis HemY N-terminal domain-containing protein [Rhodobacter sp. Har01]MCB6177884.1 heme biosynthesis protein HemY [Rhodobacter sp. Har01]
MLWSLTKVVIFLAAIAGLAILAETLLESSGEVRIWVFGQEFTLGPLQAAIAAVGLVLGIWLFLRLLGLLVAVFRFLNGDETAITRYFDRNRERRGFTALSEGMVALASGEANLALSRARTAEKLLKKPELTTLLTAQAAEAAGDGKTAMSAYKSMLASDKTRFVAIRGLMRQKLATGDTATALKLAEKALALRPRHSETQDVLLKLQTDTADWKGARATLNEKLRTGELPRSVYRRRDALLALQEAKTVLDEGSTIEAREAAIEANKMSPDLIPAAVIASRALVEKGDKKNAMRVLKKAWEARPHPDLAAAFAAIEPNESASARLRRFKPLLTTRTSDEETRLLQAELMLLNEDFRGARRILGSLAEKHPTQRTLAILAAAERGLGTDDAEVRAILARALTASRGPQWCCDKCEAVQAEWNPVCRSCGSFDTLTWREPVASRQSHTAVVADISPILTGAPQRAPTALLPGIAEEVVEIRPEDITRSPS